MENHKAEILKPSVECNMPSDITYSTHTAQPAGVDQGGVDAANPGCMAQGRMHTADPGGIDQGREDSSLPRGIVQNGVDSAHPGGVDQDGEDSAHPRGVEQGREDYPCKSCLEIKSEIDTFIRSEMTGNVESNVLKTIGNREQSGFQLGKETLINVKEENLEEKPCITDSSKGGKDSHGNIAPPGCNTPSELSHSTQTAQLGGVDLGGVDSAHPWGVDQGGEDSPCTFCLGIKAEIDTFTHSERTGNMEPNALKTIGNQELTGIEIKKEPVEGKFCVIDGSKIINNIKRDKSPPPKLSPLNKSVGPGLPLDVPYIDSTDPTETHQSHQLGPGVTTCVMLCDRGIECFHNNLGGAMTKKIKTVKRW